MNKSPLYTTIYDSLYKKNTLESFLLNLESLEKKLENAKKFEKSRLQELIETEITNKQLKAMLLQDLESKNATITSKKGLEDIILQLQAITDEARIVDFTIPLPLTEEDIQDIAKTLENKFHTKVILYVKVDPGIVGGCIIKENKYIFDASLRTHLKNYEAEWMKSLKKTRKKLDAQNTIINN